MGGCFRFIPSVIPNFQIGGLSRIARPATFPLRNGLVLVCGVVGSGKTTSFAMMVFLNKEGGYRIITVEEPVEYLFPKRRGPWSRSGKSAKMSIRLRTA